MLDSINIDRVAFSIPIPGFMQDFLSLTQLDIFWYGILVTLGIIVGVVWAAREIERRGQSIDELYNGVIVVVFSGYFFARLTYVFLDVVDGGQYDTFGQVINIRAGGVNILGGFIGAAIAGMIFINWRKLKFWDYADVAGPALLFAQAIGRWGNFINQELYGQPTELPWGILIDPQFRLAEYSNLAVFPETTRFHPTFLYESITLLIGFVLLVWLNGRYRDSWKSGTLFGIFMMWWGGNRAWIEFFRPDQPSLGDSVITYSMLAAIALFIAGLMLVLTRFGKLSLDQETRRRRRRVAKPKPRRN